MTSSYPDGGGRRRARRGRSAGANPRLAAPDHRDARRHRQLRAGRWDRGHRLVRAERRAGASHAGGRPVGQHLLAAVGLHGGGATRRRRPRRLPKPGLRPTSPASTADPVSSPPPRPCSPAMRMASTRPSRRRSGPMPLDIALMRVISAHVVGGPARPAWLREALDLYEAAGATLDAGTRSGRPLRDAGGPVPRRAPRNGGQSRPSCAKARRDSAREVEVLRLIGTGLAQRGDRAAALRLGADGRGPRVVAAEEARCPQPRRAHGAQHVDRLRTRVRHPYKSWSYGCARRRRRGSCVRPEQSEGDVMTRRSTQPLYPQRRLRRDRRRADVLRGAPAPASR